MNRRKFLAAISALPLLGWLKPAEGIPLHPTAWKPIYGYMAVKSDPRLVDPNDYYLDSGDRVLNPDVLIVRPDQEEASSLVDSDVFKELQERTDRDLMKAYFRGGL